MGSKVKRYDGHVLRLILRRFVSENAPRRFLSLAEGSKGKLTLRSQHESTQVIFAAQQLASRAVRWKQEPLRSVFHLNDLFAELETAAASWRHSFAIRSATNMPCRGHQYSRPDDEDGSQRAGRKLRQRDKTSRFRQRGSAINKCCATYGNGVPHTTIYTV
jgi:hypothetical protein